MISIKKILYILIFLNYACFKNENNCEERLRENLIRDFKNYNSNEFKKITIYYLPEFGCSSCALINFNEIIKKNNYDTIYIITNRYFENNMRNVIIFKDTDKKYLRLPCLGKRYAKIIFNKKNISIEYFNN